MLVNGVLIDSIDANDRGLLYGDGVFRTLRLAGGKFLHWSHHYRKLQQDCAALLLPCPDQRMLRDELDYLAAGQTDAVVKIIVTRGTGARGFAPPDQAHPTRILSLSPLPVYPEHFRSEGIQLRLCEMRLSHQPRLAGIKHLNRLENVLAAAEWDDTGIPEGLLCDVDGNVIEGTRSNLFIVVEGALLTPDLSRCGVAGVQRGRVIEWAYRDGVACEVCQLTLEQVMAADEVFLVNSVIGLWPVQQLGERSWARHPGALRIQSALARDDA